MLPASVPLAFDYKDPKEISAVSLTLDSPLEPIVGYAKGISGTVFFDPLHPERSTGKLAVDVSSVQFANDGYTATAQGYALNGKKWPQLLLAIRRVESVRKLSATRYSGVVLADFTCRGVTRPKRLVVTADLFPGKADERTNGRVKGDLLVLRTRFSVSRKAHGISEGIPDSMVGDAIEVGVAVVGIHATDATSPHGVGASPASSQAKKAAGGPPAPRSALLPRIGGGAPATLEALQGRSYLVVFFLNEQCGVTHAYRGRLQKLFKDFDGKGFAFVGVRTGRKQFPNRPVELPEVATLRIPFHDDADGALMRAYGIGQSLTFAVFDPQGRLRYQGGVDDSVDPAGVKKTPLRDALRSLATGRPVRVARAPIYGCAILPVEQ